MEFLALELRHRLKETDRDSKIGRLLLKQRKEACKFH
jgi:hypothetical protein